MSKINSFETSFLELIFNNDDIANIGDTTGVRGSTVTGSLWVSLWVGDPTDTGTGGAEANYTGYAREGVARSVAGWTIAGNACSNAAAITFGSCTAGSNTVTHFGIHTAITGGSFLFHGTLTASFLVETGKTPEFIIGDIDIVED